VRVAVCGRGGEGRPPARERREAEVETERRLQNHERPSRAHQREKRLIEARRRLGTQADLNRYAPLPQIRETPPAHERIGILDRRNHARDARLHDPHDARAGAPDVIARFERAVERRPAGTRTRHLQRADLGVRLAGTLVESVPDHDVVIRHDERADHRIRTRAAAAPAGQEQGAIHVVG
jgi:hypothetical protein